MVGTRIFVGNLPSDTSERDLERFFRGYGRMREVLLKNGYGFVEFDDYRDAEDAVYELNGKKMMGVRVTVEKARGTPRGRDQYYARDRDYPNRGEYRTRNDRYGPPTRTAYRLLVENLSSRVSWQDLKDYMRQAGEVTYADAHKKRRNEGVVEFATSGDMRNALDKLDNTDINGRRIKLVEDKRHSSRSSSYSSRSRSRSARKSRSSSRSRSPANKKSKSRSASRKKSVDRSRSNSRAKSRDRSMSKSRDRSRSISRGKERSTSRGPKSAERSRSPKRVEKSRSPSRERSRSRSRSRSQDN